MNEIKHFFIEASYQNKVYFLNLLVNWVMGVSMQLCRLAHGPKMRAGLMRGMLGRDAEKGRGWACEGTRASATSRRIAFSLI